MTTTRPASLFTGFKNAAAAARKAREVSTEPRTIELKDGTLAAAGDTLLGSDGAQDFLLYGAGGSTLPASEARAAGLLWT